MMRPFDYRTNLGYVGVQEHSRKPPKYVQISSKGKWAVAINLTDYYYLLNFILLL
jgi:hypothetical protein